MAIYHREDVAVSSRVRLARNYADIPFMPCMNAEAAARTVARAGQALKNSPDAGRYQLRELIHLSETERRSLMERHLVSPDLVKRSESGAALIRDDEQVSVMINEEDHLRIQAILPGMHVREASELAFGAERALSAGERFAFNERLGYLTCCPTNTGTGMRASVMLHLPALGLVKQIGEVIRTVGKIGLTVRGFYGEGSEAAGNLYQLSNQVTLGRSEDDILRMIDNTAGKLISLEREARRNLYSRNAMMLQDRTQRAEGILRFARLLSGEEFMRLWSDARFGAELGVSAVSYDTLDSLLMEAQPATVQLGAGKDLSDTERDAARAELVRGRLNR